MKFTTQIIALVAATAVNAIPVKERRSSSACDQVLDSYDECFNQMVNMKNVDSVCASYNSEKCQNFYKSGFVNEIDACKNEDPNALSLLEDIISLNREELKHICTKDENGNLCPRVKLELENKFIINGKGDSLYSQASNETCASKVCTDAYVQYLEQVKTITLQLDEKEKTLEQNIEQKIDSKVSEFDNKVSEFEQKVKDKVNKLEEGLNNIGNDIENKINEEIENIESKFKRSIENDMKEIDEEIAKFKSDQCTSQASANGQAANGQASSTINQVVSGNSTATGNTQTSDATALSYSSALVVATVLLLSTLL
jgi:hypothetical protein